MFRILGGYCCSKTNTTKTNTTKTNTMKAILLLLTFVLSIATASAQAVPVPLITDPAPPGTAFTGCEFFTVSGGVESSIGKATANLLTTGPLITANLNSGPVVIVARFYTTTVLPLPSTPLTVHGPASTPFSFTVPIAPTAAPVNVRKP
jgi:hypothetical protein